MKRTTTHTPAVFNNHEQRPQPLRNKRSIRPFWVALILLGASGLLAAPWSRPALAELAGRAAAASASEGRAGKLLAATAARLRGALTAAKSSPVAGTITGTVYRDYNVNGLQDPATAGPPARLAEFGLAGVTVTAFNAAGANAGSATTGATGVYAITTTDAGSGPYRVEFSNLPAGTFSGPFGAQSGTSVQFVDSTPAANVNLGVNDPGDYCQNNPFLAVTCFVSGDTTKSGTAAPADVLVGFPYTAGSSNPGDSVTVPPGGNLPSPSHIAIGSQMGAAWGQAYQRSSKKLFVTAVTRRHSSFGPLGAGGIYVVTDPAGAAAVANFVDVKTIGIDTGSLTNATRNLPASKTAQSADAASFDAVGKQGIGDIDISDDGMTLWLTNLNDRKLYSIFINDPPVTPTAASVQSYTIPNPGCNGGEFRSWATKVHRGGVYVGGVCTAETSKNPADLKAAVYELNPATGVFTNRLEFPLTYTKGITWVWPGVTDRRFWRPWTASFNDLIAPAQDAPTRDFLILPQPILADIEFDVDGSMILGLMDRTGMQSGYLQLDLDGNKPPIEQPNVNTLGYEGISGGDILRAFNNNGSFALENNALAGLTTGGINNGEGPGGGEYYFEDLFFVNDPKLHQEITLGSLALLPGSGQVVTNIFDPFTIRSGGIIWFNNMTGRADRRYEVFPRPAQENESDGTFGKAAGLGDLELLCDPAPLEVGNRIWLDANGNGIQDPSEAGIAGVTVQLFKAGALVGTATTNAAGQFLFNAANVNGGVLPNMAYEIRVDKNQAALNTLILTAANAGASSPNSDARDSDAVLTGNNATIAFATGNAGANDHTFDLGFRQQPPDVAIQKYHVGNLRAGDTGVYILTVRNVGASPANGPITVSDNLPGGLTYVSGTGAGWSCQGGAGNVNVTCTNPGPLAAGASSTINLTVRISLTTQCSVVNVATVSAPGDANPLNNTSRDTTNIDNCQTAQPPVPGTQGVDPGSILIFPVYTSDPANPNRENTSICLTNTDQNRPAIVHLFFVDGSSCAVADSYVCLTPNQTTCFLASDLDPGVMGYIVAIAVDDDGCPTAFNRLIGEESVKFGSGHFGNLVAESYQALPDGPPPVCTSSLAQVNLDGVQYTRPARVLAADSIGSQADGNSTLLVLLRTGGNLATGAGTIGSVFGILYDDAENAASFSFSAGCQLKQTISNSLPRTTPRFTQFIPAGRTGWMKLWAGAEIGIAGAMFTSNPNANASPGAFNGGHNLHKLRLATDSYTVPVFPPGC
jgi:uncharacterized repeat protein (TIGR01451 family)